MKIQPTRNITEILQNSSLTKIVERSNQINLINSQLQHIFPQQYRNFYRLVDFSDTLFVIEVQNAVIRQGLLLQQVFLLKLIQVDFPEITHLEIKVNPNFRAY